jgi:hypothetical protein
MHDIDRALFESETEDEEFAEAEGEAAHEYPSHEVELATELLEVSGEAELDRFLGKLISGAVSAARGFARSDAGRAVGGVLKSAAKQALPHLGSALGLETEGLSEEDSEYETARAFVRFANETARRAAQAGGDPAAAAKQAAVAAAQRHMPRLARPDSATRQQSGRWVRRGNRIVIFDA